MNALEKLLSKRNSEERAVLEDLIDRLERRDMSGLQVIKLSSSDCYRVRKGIFRIIFHYDKTTLIIDAARLRNEKTYRGY